MSEYIIDRLRLLDNSILISDFRGNWYIPFSSAMFFWACSKSNPLYEKSILISFVLMLFLSLLLPSSVDAVVKKCRESRVLAVFSLLNSMGICFANLYILWCIPFAWGYIPVLRLVFMVFGFPFVFVCNVFLWDKLSFVIISIINPSSIKTGEWILYCLILLAVAAFATYAYIMSNAFYHMDIPYDIIYTSDSPMLLKDGSYFVIDTTQNDIRQPLFGVFSAPLIGISSLIAYTIPFIPSALIFDYGQIFIIFIAMLMLTKALKLTDLQRICFMLVTSCSYMFLLSSFMMEQYAIAVFWLILTICLLCGNCKEASFASYAACGTLLTSAVFIPFTSTYLSVRTIGKWFKDMILRLFDLLLLMLLFCRFNTLIGAVDSLLFLTMFTGGSVKISDRLCQFFKFIESLFVAPESGLFTGIYWNSWQMNKVTSISIAGSVILAVAVVALIVTRKDKISRFAGVWILISAVILIVVGWGTFENGLVLYTLYFGWAYLVLIMNLLKWADSKYRTKFITPLFTMAAMICMLIVNIPALKNLMDFAVTEFPA